MYVHLYAIGEIFSSEKRKAHLQWKKLSNSGMKKKKSKQPSDGERITRSQLELTKPRQNIKGFYSKVNAPKMVLM